MIKKIVLFIFIICQCQAIYSDEILLLDGTIIKGKVKKVNTSEIEIQTIEGAPAIFITREKILKINYDDGTSVLLNEKAETPLKKDVEIEQAKKIKHRQTVSFGPAFLQFDYLENLPPPVKSSEKGGLSGFLVEYTYNNMATNLPFFLKLNIEYYSGNTDYDGSTQSGTPVKTTTHNEIMDYEFTIGLNLRNLQKKPQLGIYSGFGGHSWSRDIQGSGGYLEEYSWGYLPIGLILTFEKNSISFGVDFSILIMHSGKIIVHMSDLNKAYNDPESELGNKPGVRIKFPIKYRFDEN